MAGVTGIAMPNIWKTSQRFCMGPTKPLGSESIHSFKVGWVAGLRKLITRSAAGLLLEVRLM